MAKAVTKFVAASGTSYDDEHEAWVDDLLTYFTSVTNEGIARQIVAHIDTPHGCDNLGTILAGLQTTRHDEVVGTWCGKPEITNERVTIEPKSEETSRLPDDERRFMLFEGNPTGTVNVFERPRCPGKRWRKGFDDVASDDEPPVHILDRTRPPGLE